MIANTSKTIKPKPVLYGAGVALLGLFIVSLIFHYWWPHWALGLDLNGLTIEAMLEKIESEKFSSPPYLTFVTIIAIGWFFGGVLAAMISDQARILHSVGAGVVGASVFLSPMYIVTGGIVSALGGVLAVCVKSNTEMESDA